MSVRQYIGARYIPNFIGQWDNTRTYEPLDVVQYQGASYISRQYVPIGANITNENYWFLWSNFDPQVADLIAHVNRIDTQIAGLDTDIDSLQSDITEVETYISSVESDISTLETSVNNINSIIPSTDFSSTNTITKRFDAHLIVIGDSWSDPGGGNLPPTIGRYLNIKSENIHNFAVGGTGFLKEYQTNFPAQLAQAINDTSIPKKNKIYIAIIGGTNDYDSGFRTASDYVTVINNMQTQISANFPNAETIVFFMQNAVSRVYPFVLINEVKSNSNLPVVNLAWFLDRRKFRNELHPTEQGYKEVAAFIAKSFLGCAPSTNVSDSIDITTDFNTQFNTNFPFVSAREMWTEYSSTLYILLRNSTATEVAIFGNLNYTYCSPVYPFAGYASGQLLTLGQPSQFIKFAMSTNNRIGFNNNASGGVTPGKVAGSDFCGAIQYVVGAMPS